MKTKLLYILMLHGLGIYVKKIISHFRVQSSMIITSEESELLTKLDIDDEVALTLKEATWQPLHALYEVQMDDEDKYDMPPALRGIKSVTDRSMSRDQVINIVETLQGSSVFQGHHVFCCGRFGSDRNYYLAVIKTNDQFQSLKIFETSGINYNLYTDDIIAFLQHWQQKVEFSIMEVDHDRVVIQLQHLDFDLELFSKEALELCPDFLSSVSDAQELKKYITERNGQVDFWWD